MTGVVAILQARMGSTRLPGKVLHDLIGKPMLVHEMERILRAQRIDTIVVATTDLSLDDPVARLCREQDWHCFRGSQDDVLDRYYRAATEYRASAIVRLTADCPMIEPSVIDRVIAAFLDSSPASDYASNVFPVRTYPRGLDTEIFSMAALTASWRNERDPALREHVTQHILKNPGRFRTLNVTEERDLSGMRWTVDTPEDFAFVEAVYRYFGHNRFSTDDVLALLSRQPELLEINREIRQKEV